MEQNHEMNSKYGICGSLMNGMKNVLFEIDWCECIFDHLAVLQEPENYVVWTRYDLQVSDVLIYTKMKSNSSAHFTEFLTIFLPSSFFYLSRHNFINDF